MIDFRLATWHAPQDAQSVLRYVAGQTITGFPAGDLKTLRVSVDGTTQTMGAFIPPFLTWSACETLLVDTLTVNPFRLALSIAARFATVNGLWV